MADTKMKRGRPMKPVEIPLARQRSALLQAAGFTQETLADRIEELDGVRVSRQTVQAVLAGDFRNDDVIRHFCQVTGSKPKKMFPSKARAAA